MEEREDIIAYINTLKVGEALSEKEIRDGYLKFKNVKADTELTATAENMDLSRRL